MITREQAFKAYTERYTHTDIETDDAGVTLPITYRPMSICNNREMDEILVSSTSMDEVLTKMRDKIGQAGPARMGR